MERASRLVRAGEWPALSERDRITLPFVDRHRRRLLMRADGGTQFLLDLAETSALREGDGLALEGGGFVRVKAAPEDLLEVTASSAAALGRLAWHLGNRHLAAQIEPDRILIRDDHVIADMLRGLGAGVRAIQAPFDPESGAYGAGHGHDHGPDHDDADGHDHHHDHGHAGAHDGGRGGGGR